MQGKDLFLMSILFILYLFMLILIIIKDIELI